MHYDERFQEFTAESDITTGNRLGGLGGGVLNVSTPAIVKELDTKRAIEEPIRLLMSLLRTPMRRMSCTPK